MKVPAISPDKLAIGLSGLCLLHCLALPLFIILIPSIASLPLAQEAFHLWMVLAVIPTSLYALTLGCKKHNQISLVGYGIVGLTALISALVFGHQLGEAGEKVMTTIGAFIIAFAHLKNYRLCKQAKHCPCPENKNA